MNFKLKNPKGDKDSLILFYTNLPSGERFVYSTSEKIHPKNWDRSNQRPFYKTHPTGSNSYSLLFNFSTKNKSIFSTTILMVQIDNFLKLKEKVSKLKPRQILQLETAVICQTYRKALIHGH